VRAASLTPSEGSNPALPEETVMASPVTDAMQDNAESSHDAPSPPFSASRLLTVHEV
jgi:hypothetical protein